MYIYIHIHAYIYTYIIYVYTYTSTHVCKPLAKTLAGRSGKPYGNLAGTLCLSNICFGEFGIMSAHAATQHVT